MLVFDRQHVRRNRARIQPGHDFLFLHVLAALADRLRDIRRDFPRALQIGHRDGCDFDAGNRIGRLCRMDIHSGDVQGEEETLPFAPASFDLIMNVFSLHAVNDVPGALLQMRRALRPDGLMLAAFPGGDTLFELRESLMHAETAVRGGAGPRVLPFIGRQQAGALLQRAQYALPVVDSERITVTYDHPLKLMRELRRMGEGNAVAAREKRSLGRAVMVAAVDHYQRHFSDPDGRVRATFEIIHMTGWAPHESQQKPMRPGSAQTSLADALGTVEHGAGDRP